ncbi:gmc oxidoreductase [Moniliophthora roreri MCA 2997]|uniref:Gmc oxidoreductase n=2 Tax=Moniliophthora roreri TaxID=221103 RepID=V2WP75_MONRO|nr:gmc oxidoreductase [Moniliophthora roreri MCA 2997]
MRSVRLLSAVLSLQSAVYVTCNPLLIHPTKRFAYAHAGDQLSDSYDFVIIGGGQAGLTLASRLSEDSNTTVLVIEAGDSGEAVQDQINTPSSTYFNSLTNSEYDYAYTTNSQQNLAGRSLPWARGKILGGSSAINGMYLVRPSQIEIDAWAAMMGNAEGANAWTWSEFDNAMKKSETFTPPKDDVKAMAKIEYTAASFGSSGPIHASYPGFTYDTIGDWNTALVNANIPANSDPGSGKNWGGFVANSFINPTNWTRSYSRSAYIDPLPPRPNLSILVKSTVTKINFASSDNLTATAVEFAETRDGEKHTVGVKREVILAGGAIGSPQVLMVSGVGPRDVLEAAGVQVVHELPGVGQHLQDHLSSTVIFKTNKDTSGSLHASGAVNTPEFLSFVNSAIAYVNSSYLFGSDENAATLKSQAEQAYSESLIPSNNAEVIAGGKAIYDVMTQKIFASEVGQIELLINMMFSGSISIGVGLQHPLSQGRLYINSSSAFDYPIIDPNYFSNPIDKTIMRQGIKIARLLGTLAPLSNALQEETQPGANVVTDQDIEQYLTGQVGTEYHPGCSCAMLPKEQGGVVDAKLRVYGLNNVRVADASVFPFGFAAHLGAPTYGLAEQAANIIRAQYNGAPAPGSSESSSSGSNSGNQSGSNGSNGALKLNWSRSSIIATVMVVLGALIA